MRARMQKAKVRGPSGEASEARRTGGPLSAETTRRIRITVLCPSPLADWIVSMQLHHPVLRARGCQALGRPNWAALGQPNPPVQG